ncbi:xylulokinase [Verrucomicrobium sp. GAS474]|uniref:xylulokinase n=1 Tax=Verrucomicrobium sp. GAS474 TaxID=1882831 RepID=UPI00087A57AB|nr:xylulokinase [Verrucomicrobium sp. GAS474]SDT94200.1 xylulokinase [Verrucomicrobium sp. GAS474]
MIFLGIDCGTQSTKTIALDGETGTVLATASAATDLVAGLPHGHAEQHPADWVKALDATVAEVIAKLGARKGEVAGIGVSGQQHGLVPLDREFRVIRPAKLWCDTSTAEECDLFRAEFGGTTGLIELLGNDVLPGFTAPKILWLKRHEPENFLRLRHVALPHDYLNWHLTGKLLMEYGDASGTALFDVRRRDWAYPVVDFIDPALIEALPPVASSLVGVGELRPELASKWGLKSGVRVSSGGGDNMMGALGTGNVRAGCVTASLGTSGTLYARADAPVVDPTGEIAAFCDSADGWLPLLCTMNVTGVTEAARNLFQWDHEEFSNAVASVPPGAYGLLFLPYLQGERTPNLPSGSGVLHGMTATNLTPPRIARAMIEGATLGMAYGLARLRALGITPSEIRLTGGGSKSAVWRQLCADVFGTPVVTMESAEGAALGAAIQAASLVTGEALSMASERLAKVNAGEVHHPSNAFDYVALLERHTALTRTLSERKFL